MLTKEAHIKTQISQIRKRTEKPNSRISAVLFAICFFFIGISSYSQCAMCRAAVESEGNGQKAVAINDGIVYLMVIPYILVGAIGYYIYRMNRKKM